jgi:predicted methyltransferase
MKLLAFTGVKTGMTVLDMGAGGGYSTELMARAVGPTGKVYGQDYETGARRQGALRSAHEDAAMKNVVALARRSTIRCRPRCASRSHHVLSSSTTTPPTWRSTAPR